MAWAGSYTTGTTDRSVERELSDLDPATRRALEDLMTVIEEEAYRRGLEDGKREAEGD